ncbi:unnamed protein product [Enterobius vermicularis]|uniref:Oxysterol-binding protein n=1 Tax=Enterobius vermicularis TaxID=51028 RepID=A0A0N4VCY9_ENTVE|nr:unnamed protein product [Enterobius vermicularis]
MTDELCGNSSWRKELPAGAVSHSDVSIWDVLKQAVGKVFLLFPKDVEFCIILIKYIFWHEFSLWTMLPLNLVKIFFSDLTRITIPIVYCEPLSFLQRLAEYLEYSSLLKLANQSSDSLSRLKYVTAFAVSTLSSNHKRMAKPFNPLLFETYELDRSQHEGYRFIAEQVSHHPPVSAFHSEGAHFEFSGTVSPRLRFWGVSIEVKTGGSFFLRLRSHNEVYTWDSVNCVIHNIVLGELHMTLDGVLHIRSSSGLETKIKRDRAWSKLTLKRNRLIEKFIEENHYSYQKSLSPHGEVKTPSTNINSRQNILEADLNCKFFAETKEQQKYICCFANNDGSLIEGSNILWKAQPRPANSTEMYNFTNFTLLLNDPAFITNELPATDSRLRPDIRLLEQKKIVNCFFLLFLNSHFSTCAFSDEAAAEKGRLEVKQREAKANCEKNNLEKAPKFVYCFDLLIVIYMSLSLRSRTLFLIGLLDFSQSFASFLTSWYLIVKSEEAF